MVNINIKFGNKTLYLLIGIVVVLIVTGIAIATDPNVHGHADVRYIQITDTSGDIMYIGERGGGSGRFDFSFVGPPSDDQRILFYGGDDSNSYKLDEFRVQADNSVFTGNIGATEYCDSAGNNCKTITEMGGSGSNITTQSGTVSSGGLIPLISGYSSSQCKWIVSVKSGSAGGGWNRGTSYLAATCSNSASNVNGGSCKDSNRYALAVLNRNTDDGYTKTKVSGSLNYLMICKK